MKIKVFFIGVFTPYSTNVSQLRAFKDNGCEIYGYDFREKVNQLGTRKHRDDDIIKKVKKIKPDLIIFSKCNQLHYRVMEECNKVGKTVLWYMDSSYNFDQELIEKIKRCDFYMSGVEGLVPRGKEYNSNSSFLHQCPDDKMNFPLENVEKIYDTAFIGDLSHGIHSDRKEYIQKCDIKHFENVHGLKHNIIVNQTKININFSPTDSSGASVRVYKIFAAGGFLLTTPWTNMEQTFKDGEHLVVFRNTKELNEKIYYYLNHPELRQIIASAAHKKVQKYMPVSWAKKILDTVLDKKEIK